MVAQAILDGTLPDLPNRQTGPNSIHQEIIDWVRGESLLDTEYVCNGDSMHHVSKGIIAIRVEDTAGFSIEGNNIQNVENLSVGPFSKCSGYHVGASSENLNEYQGGNVRAISIAAVRGFNSGDHSQIKENKIVGVSSNQANAIIGIDVQGDSEATEIVRNVIDLHENPWRVSPDKYIAIRIREAVDSSVTLKNNQLDQQTLILNSNRTRGHARDLKRLHAHVTGDIEWESGGCPFASDYAKK